MRIRGVGDSVIGGRDHTFGRIIDPRQIFERNIAAPVIVVVPTGQGQKSRYVGAQRNIAGKRVADITCVIGVDEI